MRKSKGQSKTRGKLSRLGKDQEQKKIKKLTRD